MEVNQLTIREMLTYGYCPMQWHLRYRLGLPWFAASPEVFYSEAIRFAIRSWFRLQRSNLKAKSAMTKATNLIEGALDVIRQTWPNQEATIVSMHREGLLALLALPRHFGRDRDTLVAAPLSYSTSIVKGDVGVTVQGEVDAIFVRHDHTPNRIIVPVTIVNSKDPQEDMVRWSDVKQGFAHYAIRRGLERGYDLPIRHMRYPIVDREPTVKGTALQTNNFKKAALQVAKGMAAGYVMPTSNPAKCQHCPYNKVCSLSLIGKSQEDVAEEKAMQITLAKSRPTIEEIQ